MKTASAGGAVKLRPGSLVFVDWARYRERHPCRPEPTAAEPGLPWEIVGAEYVRLPGLGSRPGAEPSPVDAKIAPWRAGEQAPAGASGGDIVVPRGCLVNFGSGFPGAWREHPGASRRLLAALEHVVEHQRRRKAEAPTLVQMWGYIMGGEPLPHAAASLRRNGGPPPSTTLSCRRMAAAPRAEEADGQAAEEECTPPEAQGHH